MVRRPRTRRSGISLNIVEMVKRRNRRGGRKYQVRRILHKYLNTPADLVTEYEYFTAPPPTIVQFTPKSTDDYRLIRVDFSYPPIPDVDDIVIDDPRYERYVQKRAEILAEYY